MLPGGPRSAVEALYVLQAEEASALRAEMRGVVEELRAHHTRYQEMAALRAGADHEILDAVAAIATVVKELQILASQSDSMPERVQAVLNSADITEIHRKLGESLTVDIWARLGAHSDTEAKRFADIASRLENNVQAIVMTLRDANAGRPSLPLIAVEGTVVKRLLSKARYCYAYLLRQSADLQPLAVTIASVSVTLTAIAILVMQLTRTTLNH